MSTAQSINGERLYSYYRLARQRLHDDPGSWAGLDPDRRARFQHMLAVMLEDGVDLRNTNERKIDHVAPPMCLYITGEELFRRYCGAALHVVPEDKTPVWADLSAMSSRIWGILAESISSDARRNAHDDARRAHNATVRAMASEPNMMTAAMPAAPIPTRLPVDNYTNAELQAALNHARNVIGEVSVSPRAKDIAHALLKVHQWFVNECARTEAPIPMRLPCPDCGVLHIDEGDFATRSHHTHSCQNCGLTWRPAVVATVGVKFLPGFKNPETTEHECEHCASPRDSIAHGYSTDRSTHPFAPRVKR